MVSTDSDILQPLFSSTDTLVAINRSADTPAYSLLVLSEETLGHYADWLGIGGAGALRSLNNLRFNDDLRVGKRIRIPVVSAQQLANFEESRAEFHRILAEEYVEHYVVTDIDNYTSNNIYNLSMTLGHSSIKVNEAYLASFDEKAVDDICPELHPAHDSS